MTTRFGLQQLSSSAINSPFGSEKGITGKNAIPGPLKISCKCPTHIPSPLIGENKENATTQTKSVLFSTSEVQTDVTIAIKTPTITEEDLSSEDPTSNYYHVLANQMLKEIEEGTKNNEKLNVKLAELKEELNKLDHDLEILKEVIEEIENDSQ